MDNGKYLESSLTICKKVGEYLLDNFGSKKKFTHKGEFHYGIHEDIKANQIYEQMLKKLTPDFGIYSEEGAQDLTKKYVWVVDSLEGTSNYRVGNSFWATQLSLLDNLDPIVSVIYAPLLKQLFYASKNGGAFLNGKKIKVSAVKNTEMALISIGKGIRNEDRIWYSDILFNLIKHVRTFRHFGACGLELAYTATGMIDAYINKGSNLYDYVAGYLLVKEAGGIVTDFNGKEWTTNNREILASNTTLNKQIIKII